jgi:tellurite resistance protein
VLPGVIIGHTMATATSPRGGARPPRLDLNQALIALFLAAMHANGHMAADEAARAHHLIWSTRRFRRMSGERVGRLIERVRGLLEARETEAVIAAAVTAIPARLRPPAFAVTTDLLLADGKMDARERRFLRDLAKRMALETGAVERITGVVLLKNRL